VSRKVPILCAYNFPKCWLIFSFSPWDLAANEYWSTLSVSSHPRNVPTLLWNMWHLLLTVVSGSVFCVTVHYQTVEFFEAEPYLLCVIQSFSIKICHWLLWHSHTVTEYLPTGATDSCDSEVLWLLRHVCLMPASYYYYYYTRLMASFPGQPG